MKKSKIKLETLHSEKFRRKLVKRFTENLAQEYFHINLISNEWKQFYELSLNIF